MCRPQVHMELDYDSLTEVRDRRDMVCRKQRNECILVINGKGCIERIHAFEWTESGFAYALTVRPLKEVREVGTPQNNTRDGRAVLPQSGPRHKVSYLRLYLSTFLFNQHVFLRMM
jgi:hypothetical protein